jgi:arylsulfatase A-like enzyme
MPRKTNPKGGKKNIIVLLLDSARAKDVYGNPELHNLNSIQRHGVVYKNVVAQGTWTGAVHASLFSNKKVTAIPEVSQNFFENGSYKIDPWMVKTKFLKDGEETLANKLSAQGYSTVLFSNNPFLTSFTNLANGFDHVEDVWKHSNIKYNKGLVKKFSRIVEGGANARMAMYHTSNFFTSMLPKPIFDRLYLHLRIKLDRKIASVDGTNNLDRGASDTNKGLRKYLEGYSGMPNFLFINYMEAHENYQTDDPEIIPDKWLYLSGIRELDGYITSKIHASYRKRLKYLDGQIGRTISIMKEKGLLDNATLVLASDHGQFFGEHGLLYHSMFPYEEVTKVPLISINYENGKMVRYNEEIENPVSLLSLHDALLDISSGKEEHLDGNMKSTKFVVSEHTGIVEGWDESLLRLLKPRSKYASMIYAAKERFNEPANAIYFKDYKLIHFAGRRKSELYKLSEDPGEAYDIMAQNRGLANDILRMGG